MYDLPTNLTNVQGVFTYVATTGSGGVFALMIPIVIFFVLLLSLFDKINSLSIGVSALITSFATLFLMIAGIETIQVFIVSFAIGILMILFAWWSSLQN